MSTNTDKPFFVGWSNAVPRPLAAFLVVFAAAFLGGMAGLAFSLSATVDDPGDARFAFDEGRQQFSGIVRLKPYPVLHVPASPDREARAILLAGQGKRGVVEEARAVASGPVTAGGVLLKRGAIDMLQVGTGALALEPADVELTAALTGFIPALPEPLGRWRLTGEICDGKCTQGAMRPGRGLAHKACANLCLIGGAPPVFVSAGAVAGQSYFLLADEAGGPLPDDIYDLVALTIEVEGEVERRDSLMVFRLDLETVRVP